MNPENLPNNPNQTFVINPSPAPTPVTSPIVIQPPINSGSDSRSKIVKIAFYLTVFILISAVIFWVYILLTRIKSAPVETKTQVQPATTGWIAALVDGPVTANTDFDLNIKFSTGGHSLRGFDLVLKYDPKFLSANKTFFSKGANFDDYPLNDLDSKTGTIRISAVTGSGKSGFSGIGYLGKLKFHALTSGKTKVEINYLSNSKSDSNLIDSTDNSDILGQVYNLDLDIK